MSETRVAKKSEARQRKLAERARKERWAKARRITGATGIVVAAIAIVALVVPWPGRVYVGSKIVSLEVDRAGPILIDATGSKDARIINNKIIGFERAIVGRDSQNMQVEGTTIQR
jgi:hypothetical protein